MNRKPHSGMIAVLAAASAACATLGAGSTDLLAHGLDGFEKRGDANWSFADGVLQASTGSAPSLAVTREDYGDFDLTLEAFVSAEHNSGVFVRCPNHATVTATDCYEVNIFDKRPDQTYRTGGAPGFFKPLAQVDAGGRWSYDQDPGAGPAYLRLVQRRHHHRQRRSASGQRPDRPAMGRGRREVPQCEDQAPRIGRVSQRLCDRSAPWRRSRSGSGRR